MTPKEKAIELRDKYIFMSFIIDEDYENIKLKLMLHAKQCALIAVDEVLNLDLHDVGDYKDFDTPSEWYISYWQEVKQEIQKL